MAFYARRSLATALCRPFSRPLHPAVSYLFPPDHDCPDKPSTSSSPVPPQTQPMPLPSTLPRPSRSQASSLPFPFALYLAAHRNFSTASSSSVPDIDAAAEVLTDAASSSSVSELLSEEVATAASSISVPPAPCAGEVAAAAAESFPPVAALQHLMDLVHSFTGLNWHGVTPFTPWKCIFIQGPIFMSFFFAISNMVEKVPSLKGGGSYWFTDLTTPDDLLILPVLTSLAFLATVELNYGHLEIKEHTSV